MYPGRHAHERPNARAVVMAESGVVRTWRELDERSIRLARLLRTAGLRHGDAVAVMLENDPAWLEALWAALRSGFRLVPVNWHLTAGEAAYIVADSEARALVSSTACADLAAEVAAAAPGAHVRLAVTSAAGGHGRLDGAVRPATVGGFAPYEDALARVDATPLDDEPEGGILLYSSGTTGRPKGIVRPLPERSVRDGSAPLGLGSIWKFDADTVYLGPAPLYHAAPIGHSFAAHRCGSTVVVMERFDPEGVLRAIERQRVTHVQFVPTMMLRLLRLPAEVRARYDLSSLRCVFHAAAPCPPDVKRGMIDWLGPIVSEYYAASEGNGITVITAAEWLERPGSVGRVASGRIHILDEDGRELPVGAVGTVWFDNPAARFTYKGDDAKTASVTTRDGWTTVGDVGRLDADGYLYLSDRKAFMIISGGVNIYPAEIEGVLSAHPAVDDVAVVGVPDPEMGEQVKAVVQLAPGREPSRDLAAELIAWCRDRLAHFKCPRSVDFDDALPRTETGKLLKRVVRERYWPVTV